eukprot:14138321-Ditylum_brightwellii.AAC.1
MSKAELTQHVANLNLQFKSKDAELEAMRECINDLTAALRVIQNSPDALAGVSNIVDEGKFYCWSHGVSRGDWHTSANCRRLKKGHKNRASYYNCMGGSSAKITLRSKK